MPPKRDSYPFNAVNKADEIPEVKKPTVALTSPPPPPPSSSSTTTTNTSKSPVSATPTNTNSSSSLPGQQQQQQQPPPHQALSPFSLNFQPYLPPDAAERLGRYKYAGDDRSWLYKYFWKPTCVKIVEMLPLWLAPNVITVGALVLVVISHLIMWWYMPLIEAPPAIDTRSVLFVPPHQIAAASSSSSTAPVPGWIFVFAGVAMFLYSLLDNLDGYQARRTKTASPLGLLTDHGCDALNAFISSLSIATAISLGATWKTIACVTLSIVAFFMNTWEEYYRGTLVLPVINGPNEGIIVVIFMYFYTAYCGVAVWTDEVAYPASWVDPVIDFGVRQYIGSTSSSSSSSLSFETTKQTLVSKLFKCDSKTADASSSSSSSYCMVRHSIPLGFMLVAGIATILGNVYQVFVALRGHKKRMHKIEEAQRAGKPLEADELEHQSHGIYATGGLINHYPFLHAFNRLVPMALFLTLAISWYVLSPSDIYAKHPRVFLWTIGFLVTKLTLHLMIAHVCAIEFHPLRRTVIPFFTIAFHGALLWFVDALENGEIQFYNNYVAAGGAAVDGGAVVVRSPRPFLDSLNERVMLIEFFVLSAVTYWHAVINIVWELTYVLGRRMFSIIDLLEKNQVKKKE